MMIDLSYQHESVRLTGRWGKDEKSATSTATGSYIEFAFGGRMAVAKFDIISNAYPLLHLWVQVDGGALIEAKVDSFIRVIAPSEGNHVCRIIYKGGTELDRRWYHPLTAKVTFLGVQVEEIGTLPADNRRTVEFVGDSITEGVLIDVDFNSSREATASYIDATARCYQDDVCATWSWLTAEALDLRPIVMGYGAVGVTHAGCGEVPKAAEAYPYNFENSPITHECADIIVINHGANDAHWAVETYLAEYENLLDVIRARNPESAVVALSAFCGAHHEALGGMIEAYNQKNGTDVHFIDSFGWIPKDPLHPLREGHRVVAQHLIPLIREIMG